MNQPPLLQPPDNRLVDCRFCGRAGVSLNAVTCPHCGAQLIRRSSSAETGALIIAIVLCLIIIVFFATSAFGQRSLNRIGGFSSSFDPAKAQRQYNKPDNFTHPFRVIGRDGTNRYCDLRPFFTNSEASSWKFMRGEILQVHAHGLLLTRFSYDAKAERRYHDTFALTNYPAFTNLTDGKTVTCFALPIGSFQYRDVRGVRRTIPLYDHGTPFNPYASRKAEKQ